MKTQMEHLSLLTALTKPIKMVEDVGNVMDTLVSHEHMCPNNDDTHNAIVEIYRKKMKPWAAVAHTKTFEIKADAHNGGGMASNMWENFLLLKRCDCICLSWMDNRGQLTEPNHFCKWESLIQTLSLKCCCHDNIHRSSHAQWGRALEVLAIELTRAQTGRSKATTVPLYMVCEIGISQRGCNVLSLR